MDTISTKERSQSKAEADQFDPIEILKKLAAINSGTSNKKGVDRAGDLLAADFIRLGFKATRYEHAVYGDLRYFESPITNTPAAKVLISGHLDTVFEPESGFTEVIEDKEYLYGPGVNDMKGGLVIALTALRQVVQYSGMPPNVGIVLSPDEELGSRAHETRLLELYKKYDYAVVLEGVGNNWELCHIRKGIAQLFITASGEAGHSGHWANRRKNAIDILANCITEVVALADLERGTSINTGYVSGGGKLNIVADHAEAHFDIRYKKASELERIESALEALATRQPIAYRLERLFGPMEPNLKTERFMNIIRRAGEAIGEPVVFEERGSASDGNAMASLGVGVVDGFGVKGYGHHTHDERMVKASIKRQAALLASVIKQIQTVRT